MNVLSQDERVRVVSALTEGNSLRATERMTGVCRPAIARLLLLAGNGCRRLHDALMRDLRSDVLELDELWCFVGKKEAKVREGDPPEFGDAYTWVALDAVTKLVPAYRVSKRTALDARAFALDLRARVVGTPQISTDGFKPYLEAIEAAFGARVNYAQVIKSYRSDEAGGASRDDVRYSRGRVERCHKRVVVGSPDLDRASTSYAERNNLTTRMHVRRFTRLTNGFSKRVLYLEAAVSLHFAAYNLCRVHERLRVTPAMQAGVTDRVWSLAELLNAALTAPEPPPWPSVPPSLPVRPATRGIVVSNTSGQLFLPGVA
jgi:IS1 family transposase